MRDPHFVTLRRGGNLSPEHHRLLVNWACVCAEHLLPLLGKAGPDVRLVDVLRVAHAWERGEATMMQARQAAVVAHNVARAATDPVVVAVARAVGHAVATAHMADHAPGPVWYGLKAVRAAGQSVEAERAWQLEQLPDDIRDLICSALSSPKFASARSHPSVSQASNLSTVIR